MSFGGIGSILGSVVGTAATPAIETYIQDALKNKVFSSDLIKDFLGAEGADTLGDIAGGTLGTALSSGLNAGLGYLTGGKEGAASGALQGLVMGGGAALQHDKFKQSLGIGDEAAPSVVDQTQPLAQGTAGDLLGTSKPQTSAYPNSPVSAPLPSSPMPDIATPAQTGAKIGVRAEGKTPSYFEMTGQLAMPAWTLGMGYGASMLDNEKRKKREEEEALRQAQQEEDLKNLMSSMYGRGYAEGGGLEVSSDFGVPTTVVFPDWFVEDFAHAGGLGGYAAGGYINTQAMDPDTAYPQSMIPKAQSYPGGAPIRNEVVDFERGGLLNGDGDGMSDDIPANIEGREPVRVADGEYVVPADIAERLGEERLNAMMDRVRASAHAKKGKQIVENAGKRAFIQTMSGVKA